LTPTAFFVNIELANVYLRHGSKEEALRAYLAALAHSPEDRELRHSIQQQIKQVSTQPLDKVPTLRNPVRE